MMKRLLASAAGILLSAAAFAQPAAAATEFGDSCAATGGVSGDTLLQIAKSPGIPPPLAAPTAGVITAWKVNVVIPLEGKTYPSQLKVFRSAGGGAYTVIGQSGFATVTQGANVFPVRIPVQGGDLLGLGGGSAAIQWYCETGNPSDVLAYLEGDVPLGATVVFPAQESGLQEAVSAVLEPDADNDGFGDETQDACPQSATTQVACPVVSLNVSTTKAKKLVNVLITSTIPANVTVNGKVNLGGGKKVKLKGGTKATAPGKFTKFKLKFPAKLLDRLEELSPKQSLTLKITSSAPNIAAAPTKKTVKVKLKGRG